MGIMSIVKNVIEHFRKAGKTENEILGMIEQAADRETVNKKWCKVMIQRLSIKLFGAKAIENDKNGVKTG